MKYFLIILLLCFSLTGCSDNSTNNKNNDYNVSKTTTINNNSVANVSDTNTNLGTNNENIDNVNTEIELSSFSTKIYTPNDEARQNNIKITCSKLNGTIVKSRRHFFFLRNCRKSYS